IAIEIETIRELPHALRERGWTLTATLWNEERLTSLEPGDTRSKCYGLAVDIGTTKMAAFLVDLNTGQIMSTQSMMNPQILYGEDIISRITHATKGLRTLKELQRSVVRDINQMLKDGCRDAGVKTRDVHMVTIVGNTAMHHLFLGIYPGYVALAPYPPVLGKGIDVEASKLRLRTHPRANIYVLPTIGGFVGADNVGLILATRILESEEMTLALDIGTNTEIVLGNKEEARVCSCASGPAFEGAHIQHGMRATTGAIERIAVEPETLAVYYKTIDNAKPVGI
ncbi:MAG: DUF4445 domain-containing protein, partial [Nitrososphaeria archaeon]|nr:DUF4445 domain-containing protein [Nitrososphaeria archaeon]